MTPVTIEGVQYWLQRVSYTQGALDTFMAASVDGELHLAVNTQMITDDHFLTECCNGIVGRDYASEYHDEIGIEHTTTSYEYNISGTPKLTTPTLACADLFLSMPGSAQSPAEKVMTEMFGTIYRQTSLTYDGTSWTVDQAW